MSASNPLASLVRQLPKLLFRQIAGTDDLIATLRVLNLAAAFFVLRAPLFLLIAPNATSNR
jgi:hypothetical protein